jgi:hypothetical protein
MFMRTYEHSTAQRPSTAAPEHQNPLKPPRSDRKDIQTTVLNLKTTINSGRGSKFAPARAKLPQNTNAFPLIKRKNQETMG